MTLSSYALDLPRIYLPYYTMASTLPSPGGLADSHEIILPFNLRISPSEFFSQNLKLLIDIFPTVQ